MTNGPSSVFNFTLPKPVDVVSNTATFSIPNLLNSEAFAKFLACVTLYLSTCEALVPIHVHYAFPILLSKTV